MSFLSALYATAAQGSLAATALQSVPAQNPAWVKYTKTYTDLAAAGLTNDIELFSLAAKEVIHAVVLKASTAFSGGTIATYTLSVGISGTIGKYAPAFDVKQTVGNNVFGFNELPGMENFSSATSIRLGAISTVGLLNAATAGVVDVWVLKSTLP